MPSLGTRVTTPPSPSSSHHPHIPSPPKGTLYVGIPPPTQGWKYMPHTPTPIRQQVQCKPIVRKPVQDSHSRESDPGPALGSRSTPSDAEIHLSNSDEGDGRGSLYTSPDDPSRRWQVKKKDAHGDGHAHYSPGFVDEDANEEEDAVENELVGEVGNVSEEEEWNVSWKRKRPMRAVHSDGSSDSGREPSMKRSRKKTGVPHRYRESSAGISQPEVQKRYVTVKGVRRELSHSGNKKLYPRMIEIPPDIMAIQRAKVCEYCNGRNRVLDCSFKRKLPQNSTTLSCDQCSRMSRSCSNLTEIMGVRDNGQRSANYSGPNMRSHSSLYKKLRKSGQSSASAIEKNDGRDGTSARSEEQEKDDRRANSGATAVDRDSEVIERTSHSQKKRPRSNNAAENQQAKKRARLRAPNESSKPSVEDSGIEECMASGEEDEGSIADTWSLSAMVTVENASLHEAASQSSSNTVTTASKSARPSSSPPEPANPSSPATETTHSAARYAVDTATGLSSSSSKSVPIAATPSREKDKGKGKEREVPVVEPICQDDDLDTMQVDEVMKERQGVSWLWRKISGAGANATAAIPSSPQSVVDDSSAPGRSASPLPQNAPDKSLGRIISLTSHNDADHASSISHTQSGSQDDAHVPLVNQASMIDRIAHCMVDGSDHNFSELIKMISALQAEKDLAQQELNKFKEETMKKVQDNCYAIEERVARFMEEMKASSEQQLKELREKIQAIRDTMEENDARSMEEAKALKAEQKPDRSAPAKHINDVQLEEGQMKTSAIIEEIHQRLHEVEDQANQVAENQADTSQQVNQLFELVKTLSLQAVASFQGTLSLLRPSAVLNEGGSELCLRFSGEQQSSSSAPAGQLAGPSLSLSIHISTPPEILPPPTGTTNTAVTHPSALVSSSPTEKRTAESSVEPSHRDPAKEDASCSEQAPGPHTGPPASEPGKPYQLRDRPRQDYRSLSRIP